MRSNGRAFQPGRRGDRSPECELHKRDAYATSLRLSRFLEQFAQPARGLITIDFARRHVENELFPIVDRQFPVGQKTVLFQKNEARREGDPFVAINERVVFTNVKKICRCDFDWIRNERLPHHRCLRRGHGRFKECLVANPSRATVGSDHFAMNRFDGVDRQMLERLAQDKRLKSAAFFLIKRFAVLAAVSGSITGWIGVKTIEPPG